MFPRFFFFLRNKNQFRSFDGNQYWYRSGGNSTGIMRANRIACRTSAATLLSHVFAMTSAMTSAPYVSIVRMPMFSVASSSMIWYERWIGCSHWALGSTSVKCATSQPIELLADMSCLGRRVGERDGAIERHPRLLGAAQLEQERAPCAVEVEIAAELARKRLDHGESVSRTADLGDRNSVVDRDNRRGLHALQRAVEQIDLAPVRVLGPTRTGAQGSDRCLHLVGAGPAVPHRLVDQRQPLGDQPAVPERAILILEQYDAPLAIEAGRRAGVLEHEKRRETHHLRLGREQPQPEARRPAP